MAVGLETAPSRFRLQPHIASDIKPVAVRAGAGYLVTRNVPDFRAGPLPALEPAELLALL